MIHSFDLVYQIISYIECDTSIRDYRKNSYMSDLNWFKNGVYGVNIWCEKAYTLFPRRNVIGYFSCYLVILATTK